MKNVCYPNFTGLICEVNNTIAIRIDLIVSNGVSNEEQNILGGIFLVSDSF